MTTFLANNEPDEQQLLKKVAEGDQRAFSVLFKTYAPGLAQYVFRISESREVTEEIIQDVFTVIWEKRTSLTALDNINNYIFIISRNKTLDYLRRQAADRCKQMEWSSQLEEEFDQIDRIAEKEELGILIDEVVEKLPPQQRLVYTLSRVERLKYEEIAQRLGLTKETVKQHMKLALLFLRTNVKFLMERVVCYFLLLLYFLF